MCKRNPFFFDFNLLVHHQHIFIIAFLVVELSAATLIILLYLRDSRRVFCSDLNIWIQFEKNNFYCCGCTNPNFFGVAIPY